MIKLQRTLRGRLTYWYCGALTVFLALFGPALYLLVRNHLAHHHDFGLRAESAKVLQILAEHEDCLNLTGQQQESLNGIGRLMVIHEVGGLRQPFFKSAELASHPLAGALAQRVSEIPAVASFETFEQDGNLWRVISVPYSSHVGRKGVIRLMVEMGDIREILQTLRISLFWLTGLGIGLSWVGGYWISGKALRPIHDLADRAQKINAGNLGERLPHPGVDSEIGRLVETLNRAFARLDEAFATMRRVTADASHELRNPLATLQNSIEVALEKPRSPEEHARILVSLGEETSRLRMLVNDLLLLARADAGAVKLQKGPVRLDQVVEDQVSAFRPQAEERMIDLQYTPSAPIVVAGDERWLHQLLGNLLDNALKFTPSGGSVAVGLHKVDVGIQLSVADTGPGIPPEDLIRIFDRFYRADPARSHGSVPGTGLGLSIASWIAKMHEGELRAENRPGGGALFIMQFPSL